MKTLLFQGDSITDCGRALSGGPGYPQVGDWGPGYPRLIGSYLYGTQPGKWTIYNRGVGGNRVVDLYARWKSDCINLAPDLVSILVGVNDTWHEKCRQNGVEVPRYDKFYRMLLDWTLEALPNTRFLLMEPYVLQFGEVGESWVPEIKERAAVVRQIAEDYRKCARFVPLQQPFQDACKLAPQEYWLVDGVHPQPAGHQLIMNEWLKVAGDWIK